MVVPVAIETLLVAVLLAAAALSVAWSLGWTRRSLPAVLVVCLGVPAAVAWGMAQVYPPPPPESSVTNRPIQQPSEDFVSSSTCQACHPGHYASWHASYHRTMTRVPSPETMPTSFDGRDLFAYGHRYRVERRGDTFWVDMYNADPFTRQNQPRLDKPIVLATGSHHEQIFWYPTGDNRKLAIFPFVWRIQDKHWLPIEAAFLMPPLHDARVDTRFWNTGCLECHATNGQPRVQDPETMDTHVGDFGIACESCHGPAKYHVLANQRPWRRYLKHLSGDDDDLVVNPEKLDKEREVEVCGQCHGIKGHDFVEAEKFMNGGLSYRPGADLDSSRVMVSGERPPRHPMVQHFMRETPEYLNERFWSDGMVRVSGREYNGLLESACYTRGPMTCLSCHVLHKRSDDPRTLEEWAPDQLKLEALGDGACVECHAGFEGADHVRHDPASSGARCTSCHMPYTTYGLMKAIRSHTITSPSVQESLETGRPNACNTCHLDRTLEWTAQELAEGYDIAPPASLSDEERSVASGVLWTLTGDAGQRALMAWYMGWDDAREAAGSDWMPPYLTQLFEDPYPAVRYMARRSLRLHPGFEEIEFDPMGTAEHRAEVHRRTLKLWGGAQQPGRPELLVDGEGAIRRDVFGALWSQRNDRVINLQE